MTTLTFSCSDCISRFSNKIAVLGMSSSLISEAHSEGKKDRLPTEELLKKARRVAAQHDYIIRTFPRQVRNLKMPRVMPVN